MLISLFIQNVVLIKELSLDFSKGLTVLTGQTGAGKSILLDSLSLILGERSDVGLIRKGAEKLSVMAEFRVPKNHPARALLEENDIEMEEDTLLVGRLVFSDGKSKAKMNGTPVPMGTLKKIIPLLLQIHGQFSSYSLLNPDTHLSVLDRFGDFEDTLLSVQTLFKAWKNSRKALEEEKEKLMTAKKQEEFLTFSVQELSNLDLKDGEEDALLQKRMALMNAEKIAEAINQAYEVLANQSESPFSLYKVEENLQKASRLSDGLFDEEVNSLSEVTTLLEEITSSLENKVSDFDSPKEQLEALDTRLFALKDMARKYNCSIVELTPLLQKYQTDLTLLEQGEEALNRLQKQESENRLAYLKEAKALHQKRVDAAKTLDLVIEKELPALKLEKGRFKTEITPLEEKDWGDTGLDKVSFLVAMNEGTDLAPLHKTASGGELSRLILALKVNLVEEDNDFTLIFDEIDSGVSGATAQAVGERLERLSKTMQILVVTHSPQVASCGNEHLLVEKASKDGQTETTVLRLSKEERIKEIARMLSGEKITNTALEHAESLLKN
ncbi:MAG: DNA repair protein RecN [Alphaproteobacteria bacterium]|nr:DNA repair protein RecN [Alphaproteobacteria bacterium]